MLNLVYLQLCQKEALTILGCENKLNTVSYR